RKLYLKILRQFIEQQGSAVADISAALTKGDITLAERLAHTLKGVAGNIGAKTVQSAAGTWEKLIRDRTGATELESAKQKVRAALDPLLAQLPAALNSTASAGPTPSAPTAAADPQQSRDAAAQLTRLLSESDPGATDYLEANQAALRSFFTGDTWTPFEKLVQDYAFIEAQARLAEAVKPVNK